MLHRKLRNGLGAMSLFAASLLPYNHAEADVPVEYHASVTAQASSESLAPYMLGSWNQGRFAEGSGFWQEAGLVKNLDLNKRFSWSAGVDYIAGYGSKTDYDRWHLQSKSWSEHGVRRAAFRIQQLFGEVKYRSLFLTLGQKYSTSPIVDESLSSGDVVRSCNASPIPGVAAGFLDFQNIPFTKGWVQIEGQLMYGRMTDSGFKDREFNYYAGVKSINLWYNYKRVHFRTNPSKPFHVIVGLQAAGLFAGASQTYQKGELKKDIVRGFRLKDAFNMLLPTEGGENYYTGSHLGSWDFKANYDFKNGSRLSGYFEWLWEDGSGIGKLNGWDGLWGLQYEFPRKGIVSKIAIEYLDFVNQSGPIHFDPEDHPGNHLSGRAEGADDYYNNGDYGAYTNYGMGIGTPFLVAPVYNRNGALDYLHNRARGCHVAMEGNPNASWSYRAMYSYQRAGGNGWTPAMSRKHSNSLMVEAKTTPLKNCRGFEIGARLALDSGDLRGNNFGMQLRLGYSGEFSFKSSKK